MRRIDQAGGALSLLGLGVLIAGCSQSSPSPPPALTPPAPPAPVAASAGSDPATPSTAEVQPLEEKPLFVQAVLGRRQVTIVRSRVDAVNSRLQQPIEEQAVGTGGRAPVEGSGQVASEASELFGDVQTTHEIDPKTGAPFPLDAAGFLTGEDRQAVGAAVRLGSVVHGSVEIGQGAILVDGPPAPGRITRTATTRGIAESGLSPGEGFLPQANGSYVGGQIGEGSVLGVDRIERSGDDPPLELERTPTQLRNELRVLAASRGAASLEPGPDGEVGTDDDAFVPLRFDAPLDPGLPSLEEGTDLREANTGVIRKGTLTGSITLQASGSPFFFRHVDLGDGDVLTLEPGVQVFAVGKAHDKKGLGPGGRFKLGKGARLVCQGDAKLGATKELVLGGTGKPGDRDDDLEDESGGEDDDEDEDDEEDEGEVDDEADDDEADDDEKEDQGVSPTTRVSRVTCEGQLSLCAPRIRLDGRLEARDLIAYAFGFEQGASGKHQGSGDEGDGHGEADDDDGEDDSQGHDDDEGGDDDEDSDNGHDGADDSHGELELRKHAELVVSGDGVLGAGRRIRFRNSSLASFGGLRAEVASRRKGRFELGSGAQLRVAGNLHLEAAGVRLKARSVLRAGGTSEIYSLCRFLLGEDATLAAAPPDDPERLTHPGGALASLVYVMGEEEETEASLEPGSTFVGCLQGTLAHVTVQGGPGEPDAGLPFPGVYGAVAGEVVALEDAVLRYDAHVGRFTGDVRGVVLRQIRLASGSLVTLPANGARVTAVDVTGELLSTFTAANGTFLLRDVPGPLAAVTADGVALGLTRVVQTVAIVRQQEVVHRRPWVLVPYPPGIAPSLDSQGCTVSAVTVENPDLPGVSLEIPAGACLVPPPDLLGSPLPPLAVHELSLVDLPAPLPAGVLPGRAYSFQPEGLEVEGGFTLSLPAPTGSVPELALDLYQFDPAVGEFVVVGQAVVTPDGTQAVAQLDSFLYPFFLQPPPTAGAVVKVSVLGQVVNQGVGVNGLTVSTRGESAPTEAVGGGIDGVFGMTVLGRVGEQMELRVEGMYPEGTVSIIVSAPVVLAEGLVNRGRLDPTPFVITLFPPVIVTGRVEVAAVGLPAANVLVSANGAEAPTNFRGEFSIGSVPVQTSGTFGGGGSTSDLVITATRTFANSAETFAASLTIPSGSVSTTGGTIDLDLPPFSAPLSLVGPQPSPGQPPTPGTPGIPYDPSGDVDSGPAPIATGSGPGGPVTPGPVDLWQVQGLEYDAQENSFWVENLAGNTRLLKVDRRDVFSPNSDVPSSAFADANVFTPRFFPFGQGFLTPGDSLSVPTDLPAEAFDRGFIAYGGDLTASPPTIAELIGFEELLGPSPAGLFELPLLSFVTPVPDPVAYPIVEADRAGGVVLGVFKSPGTIEWYVANPTAGVGLTRTPGTTPGRNPDYLIREPGSDRFFISSLNNGVEEVDPFTGDLVAPLIPGNTTRLFWPVLGHEEEDGGEGRNLFGVLDESSNPIPVSQTTGPGPSGTKVVAIKRTDAPGAGNPHIAGRQVLIYDATLPPNGGPDFRIYGIAFGRATSPDPANPNDRNLFVLLSDFPAASAATATVRLVELDFDWSNVFDDSQAVFGTAGNPGQPPVLDSNGDGLIDAIEQAVLGRVPASANEDHDGLTLLSTSPESPRT